MISCPQCYLRRDRAVARQQRLYRWRMSVIRDTEKGDGVRLFLPTKVLDLYAVPMAPW